MPWLTTLEVQHHKMHSSGDAMQYEWHAWMNDVEGFSGCIPNLELLGIDMVHALKLHPKTRIVVQGTALSKPDVRLASFAICGHLYVLSNKIAYIFVRSCGCIMLSLSHQCMCIVRMQEKRPGDLCCMAFVS